MDDAREKAFALFAEGKKINTVAKALFKNNWARTKKLHDEWRVDGGESQSSALDLAKPAGDPGDSDEWNLMIKMPSTQLDAVIATFNPCEKATAIQTVLQLRFDAALGIEAA